MQNNSIYNLRIKAYILKAFKYTGMLNSGQKLPMVGKKGTRRAPSLLLLFFFVVESFTEI